MTEEIAIGKFSIGIQHNPLIIAEMSGNHNQSLKRALEIVDAASVAGVNLLKLQTYTAETMTLNLRKEDFLIVDENSPWRGKSLYDLYEEAYTPWEWHEPIIERATKLGMLCFSTPFDETAVDFLEQLNIPAYKIASFENTDLPLIRKVASTGKPMFISTGMATVAELGETVQTARDANCNGIVLLKCTSSYPSTPKSSNVLTIPHMREMFGCEVGLSDHTMGVGVAVAAVAHGATVIEKHFTLSRADGGVDSAFSLEPEEMKMLVMETHRAWESLGEVTYGPIKAEEESFKFRRSLYISKDMKADEILTPQNLRCVRPGMGLPPKYYDLLLGLKLRQDVKKGTAVKWDMVGL